jgi:hypothetical protein
MDEITEQKKMIEKFQCPGCVSGSNTSCEKYCCPQTNYSGFRCGNHIPETILSPGGKICLGLPTGFNKVGQASINMGQWYIRLYNSPPKTDHYDKFNVPVWIMEKEGYLFVRCFSPRVNRSYVDVFKNGKKTDVKFNPIDVAEFIDEID